MALVEADPAALLATAAAPAARPGVRAVRPARPGGRHPDRDRLGRVRLLHRAGARGARGGGAARRDGADHVRRAAAPSIAFPNGHPTLLRLRDMQAQPGPRPPGGRAARSCSSATARATDTPPATATSSWPSARSCGSASRPAGRSSAGRSSARSRRGWRSCSPRGGADPDAPARADRRAAAQRFFCGPEVWGEGLVDPPPGSWPPPRE